MSRSSAARVDTGCWASTVAAADASNTSATMTHVRPERMRPSTMVLLLVPSSLPRVQQAGGAASCRGPAAVLSLGTMSDVGMIGLGLLGHALASRLLASGYAVVGHDVL